MADPTIDPSIMTRALDWAWAAVLGLVSILSVFVGVLYRVNEAKHDKSDTRMGKIDEQIDHEVRCVRVQMKSKAEVENFNRMIEHIAKLFDLVAENRDKNVTEHGVLREIIDRESKLLNTTMTLNQREVMHAIAEIKQQR